MVILAKSQKALKHTTFTPFIPCCLVQSMRLELIFNPLFIKEFGDFDNFLTKINAKYFKNQAQPRPLDMCCVHKSL